jgi:two-component system chemotaxis sensor kinase CheA
MIADKELCNLFRIESEERLQHLDSGLLLLEKTPTDQPLLEELFREAHSLKGAARMLGLTEIQTMAHQLEDALGAAKKGEAALQPEAVAGMNQTLMAIRGLVQREVEPDAEVGVRSAELKPESVAVTPSIPHIEFPIPNSTAPHSDAFHIETIHVDPKKLDALLTQAGELTVTKIRIARRLTEMDELLDYCEEWGRAAHGRKGDAVGRVAQRLESLQEMLNHLRGGANEDSARLDFIADQLENGIRTLRLLPMSTLFALFPRLVHDLAREQNKEIELIVEGEETVADKRVLEEMKDPLMHMLRNAIGHGIEAPEQRAQAGKPRSGTICIKASQTPSRIVIEVGDDGRGLDMEEIKRTALKQGMYREDELAAMSTAQLQSLILVSGFSTSSFITDVSGRGVGLDVVRNNVERLKGVLQIESLPGKGLTLRAQLPVSLATVRVLVIAAHGQRYALPVEHVQFSRKVQLRELYAMEGRRTVSLDGQAISVAWLNELLEVANGEPHPTPQSNVVCVVLTVGEERFGLIVDELLDELEIVLKPQSRLLKRVRNVAGATILETGEVCVVLNPYDLLKTLRKRSFAVAPVSVEAAPAKKVLLLAEDSITTRTQEKRILEGAGYEVVTAVDGMDAYNKLGARPFDALVTDILMPNMSGLVLTEKIRADKKYSELPIILVTSLASEEDQRRGLEAGANAYIAKPSFDQQVLLECLARLI